jgi:hypothetical protein
MTDANDQFVHAVNLIEQDMKRKFGTEHTQAAIESLTERVASGELSRADIVNTLSRPGAAEALFYDGMSYAPRQKYDAWRSEGPHRKERIRRTQGG